MRHSPPLSCPFHALTTYIHMNMHCNGIHMLALYMFSCIQRQFSHLHYLQYCTQLVHCTSRHLLTLVTTNAPLYIYCDACLNLHTIPYSFCRLIFHVRICISILEIYERLCNSCTGPPHAPNACFQCALCPCFSAPCVCASVRPVSVLQCALCPCFSTVPGVPPLPVYTH